VGLSGVDWGRDWGVLLGATGCFDWWHLGGLWADQALGFWVYIRFCECCGLRFRPYGGSPFSNAGVPAQQKGNRKGLLLRSALAGSGSFAPGLIRVQRLRFASLHLLPLCSTSSNGRCAPTPGSIPPLSLPTSPVDQDQKRYSSLRSLWSGAASPRAAALLCLGFCRSEPARDAARPGLRGIEFV